MKSIGSKQNPLFKRVRDAMHEHAGEIVIEGPKQVADAIARGWRPIALITRGSSQLTAHSSQDVVAFSHPLFDAVAETKSPQNILALFERPRFTFADLFRRTDSIVVALDGVQDPGNVGTVVRLAAAFDCAGVAVLPGSADPFSPKAVRASAGAVLGVPVTRTTARELIDSRWPIFAADAAGSLAQPPARRAVLVFGSEGMGVSDEIRKAATAIAVTMSRRVESLNVAAAAAILLWRSLESRVILSRAGGEESPQSGDPSLRSG